MSKAQKKDLQNFPKENTQRKGKSRAKKKICLKVRQAEGAIKAVLDKSMN